MSNRDPISAVPASAREALRSATWSLHQLLERVPLLSAVAAGTPTAREYRTFLSCHRALLAPLELRLAPFFDAAWTEARLRRSTLAERDLADLGGAVPVPEPALPQIGSRAQALGTAYVLEGSTLGLRAIRPRLLAGSPTLAVASRFLAGNGADTHARWQAFIDVLEQLPAPTWSEAADAASATFAATHAMFAEAVVPSDSAAGSGRQDEA